MCELLQKTVEDTLVLVCHDSLGVNLYFPCDEVNKRGTYHMIKHISFYDIEKDKLIACELDSDACM